MLIRPRSTTVDPQGLMATGYKYYIGQPFTDPTNVANQLTILNTKDGAVLSNPLDINANGQFINANGQKVTPKVNEEAYSVVVLSPNGGVWDQEPNVESDNIETDGQNDTVVDQVYDYLSLAIGADLSAFDYIYVRSELSAPNNPLNGGYYHSDGTTGSPSTGDINKFFDSEGKGFTRDHEQRFSEDLDVNANRDYAQFALARGTRGNFSGRFEVTNPAGAVGDLDPASWQPEQFRESYGGLSITGTGVTSTFGGKAPLGSSFVAAHDRTAGQLRSYRVDQDGNLAQVGTGLAIGGNSTNGCVVDYGIVAIGDATANTIQAYQFNYISLTFSALGAAFSYTPSNQLRVLTMKKNRILLVDYDVFANTGIGKVLDFDGASWTQVGTDHTFTEANPIGFINETDVLTSESGFPIKALRYDETADSFTQIGQSTSTICLLYGPVINNTDIWGTNSTTLGVFRFNGVDFDFFPVTASVGVTDIGTYCGGGLFVEVVAGDLVPIKLDKSYEYPSPERKLLRETV